ncbi:MAG: hypothetical protein M3230_07270 [Thermoproteota archaeon]|nr:hypothetical protein [Thermoproteota archaeon]
MPNLRYVLSVGLTAATLSVVLTYALGAEAILKTPYAEPAHNLFMSIYKPATQGMTGGHSSTSQMHGDQASSDESTMQGMSESQMQEMSDSIFLGNNVLGSPPGMAAAGLATVVLMGVIPLAAAAFVISWGQRSFVVAGLLTASGIILMILPLANMNFAIPGPIIGVVVGLAILGLGVAKGIRTARAMTTKHQGGLIAAVAVIVLASGVFFTFSSIYGSTSVTAGIDEQDIAGNRVNNTDGGIPSSSDITNNSSQISQYAGQEVRGIKSLSDNDVQSLQNGSGEAFDGLAKLAELNGYPGPRHVLDMASELQLTDRQRMEIERIYQNMSDKAKGIGSAIIGIEQDIDGDFANKTITKENLKLMLDNSADLYGQLRSVHLSAHLDTVQILSIEQVQMYNMMRGYDSDSAGNTSSSISNYDSSSGHQHLTQ